MRKQCGNSENTAKTSLNYNYFLRFSTQIFPDFWPQATLNPARLASKFSSFSSLPRLFAIQKSIILRKQCENGGNNAKTLLNYNYSLRFSTQIFPDFWPQATLNPARAASHFCLISPLSRLFAIQKLKQSDCESNAKTTKTPRKYSLRFSTQIFPDFWPQATPSIGRRPNPSLRPQAASHNRPQAKHPTPSPCEKKFVLNKIFCTFAAQESCLVSCKEQGDAAGSAGSPGLRRTPPGAPFNCHFLRMQGGISGFVD